MRTMIKLLAASAAVLAWASAGTAAPVLNVVATELPGDQLEVNVTGNSDGELAGSFQIELVFDPALGVPVNSGSGPGDGVAARGNLQTSSGITSWAHSGTSGSCLTADTCRIDVFDDIATGGIPIDLLESTIGSWVFDVSGVTGEFDFSARASGPGYFSVASGTVLDTIQVQVPEPGSMALLGLGLMGLAAVGRRR